MLQFSMPRKYRFTHFKNGERKKQAANKSMTCIAKPNDELHSLLNNTDLEHGWISVPDGSNLRLCKCIDNVQATPHHTTFSHELTIRDNCTWSLLIHGFLVDHENVVLSSVPGTLDDPSKVLDLLHTLDGATICPGNPDEKFVEMVESRRKGRLLLVK